MNGIMLILIAVGILSIGYRFYSKFLYRKFKVDDSRPTPAHTQYDGIDYVPTKVPVLLGHHFASIAGVGPIVGPVIATAFGWIPVFLWVTLGLIFIGGVHDYSAVIISIRHKGKSIGTILKKNIGVRGKQLFLLFCWATIILVIAVFINIVADTFVTTPSSATSSLLFLFLAIAFGISIYRLKVPLWLATTIGVILLFGGVVIGNHFPIYASREFWQWALIIYIFIASVAPVWVLLQPRDYLNSFLLYALILGGVVGIFFFHPQINLHPITNFSVPNLGPIFPILFVTVACGAISGFHALVASGTTSKQLNKESDARVIGYGGMLIEGLLAVIALIAVASLSSSEFDKFYSAKLFVPAFAEGIGRFIHSIPFLHISMNTARTFAALAVSAFALTSLDTATRIGRYAFQEFFEMPERTPAQQNIFSKNRYVATSITVLFGVALTFSGKSDAVWPIFGSANQLLAALTLFAVTAWLATEHGNYLLTLIPATFMLIITVMALIMLSYATLVIRQNYLLGITAILLLILAGILTTVTIQFIRKKLNKTI